jgi:hypothetical protein
MAVPGPNALIAELSAHPHIDAIAARVYAQAAAAADQRQRGFATPGANSAAGRSAELPELSSEQAETERGNVLEMLERGVEKADERLLLGALLALGAAKQAPGKEAELAVRLIWLATHTPCSAFATVDAAFGDRAEAIWEAVAKVDDYPQLLAADFDNGEALVAALALRQSESARATKLASELSARSSEPWISAVLVQPQPSQPPPPPPEPALPSPSPRLDPAPEVPKAPLLTGELAAAPRGPALTALLALTLVLPVLVVMRLIGRYALAFRRPAAVGLSERGLELEYRSELLGRVLRERSVLVPLSNLASVTRELRYARAGLYAGLIALVVGSYLGVGLLADGFRVPGGSLPLIGLAVLLIAGGLALDFVLSSVGVNARGRCRLVVVPRKGRAVCISDLDPARTDALLASVARHSVAPAARP